MYLAFYLIENAYNINIHPTNIFFSKKNIYSGMKSIIKMLIFSFLFEIVKIYLRRYKCIAEIITINMYSSKKLSYLAIRKIKISYMDVIGKI